MSLTVEINPDFIQSSLRMDIAIRKALTLIGSRIVFRMVIEQEKLRPKTIATGQTIRSHSVSRVFKTGSLMWVEIGPRTGYSRFGIQAGRKPGTPPPLKAIMDWVREKPGGSSIPTEELFAISKSVQRTIGIHGTPAFNILTKALDAERGPAEVIIRLAIVSALRG